MHIWWNLENELQVSSLKGNLIINYHLPFDDVNSGLSIIGKNVIEGAINTIFRQLDKEHKSIKLVHIPEFVVERIDRKRNYIIEEELDYNEYILDSQALATLEGSKHGKTRRQVNHFLRAVEKRKVDIVPLDLSSEQSRLEVLNTILKWEKSQPSNNDPEHTEHDALRRTITHSELLDIHNLGLYIDNELHAVILYHKTLDRKYIIINHLRVNYSTPFIYDYMMHHIATKALEENIKFLNMEMDLGILNLRLHKMGYRPIDFFRQYSIRPRRKL
jgi:hypothetical protein